jgi:hypothetical protein
LVLTQLWGVQQSELDDVWHDALPFIQRVVDKGSDKTAEEIYKGLKDRRYQLWIAWDEQIRACCITETIHYEPDGLLCTIVMCAGDNLRRWIKHIKTIEEWAESKGCFAIELVGRKGWEKILKYKVTGNDGNELIMRKLLK